MNQTKGVRIPAYDLLHAKMAVCLEHDRRLCRRPAEWERYSEVDGSWGALCDRCVRYYDERGRRRLDEQRGCLHIVSQLRNGTLHTTHELALIALARSGGVSFPEYLDLAGKMLIGEPGLRARLKEAFPALKLELWEPATGNTK